MPAAETGDRGTVLVTGASGVVGRHLCARLEEAGLRVLRLTHGGGPGPGRLRWEPAAWAAGPDRVPAEAVAFARGTTAVVNLAGASIAEGRLDARLRRRILQSRLDAAVALGRLVARLDPPPACWFQASAVGYYGDAGDHPVTEEHPAGDLFLSEVCVAWEEAGRRAAAEAGVGRFLAGRIGLVLAADAPAWRKMLTPIRLGLGGPLGSGGQWYPWIAAADLAGAICFLLDREDAAGPFNLTAPHPERQRDLVRKVARRLRRPSGVPAPAFTLRLMLGKMADELLLPSCRALPDRLLAAGFRFRYERIETLLPEIC